MRNVAFVVLLSLALLALPARADILYDNGAINGTILPGISVTSPLLIPSPFPPPQRWMA